MCATASDAVHPKHGLPTEISDIRVCARSCPGVTTHGNVADPVGMLVGAAGSGCIDCVSFLVNVKGINPLECRTDFWKLNAVDVATAGALVNWPGCSAVADFLQGYIKRHSLVSKINEGEL